MDKILYTAYFVNNKAKLYKKFPTSKKRKYYDHCTIKWKPDKEEADYLLGQKEKLHIIGRLITDRVDVLVIETSGINYHQNAHDGMSVPVRHITLGTAIGILPVVSNEELRAFFEGKLTDYLYQDIDEYVDATRGKYILRKRETKIIVGNE